MCRHPTGPPSLAGMRRALAQAAAGHVRFDRPAGLLASGRAKAGEAHYGLPQHPLVPQGLCYPARFLVGRVHL